MRYPLPERSIGKISFGLVESVAGFVIVLLGGTTLENRLGLEDGYDSLAAWVGTVALGSFMIVDGLARATRSASIIDVLKNNK